MTLSHNDLDRYARHIILREIGGPGQAKLRAARVLCIGAGGLGSPLLMYLAAAGIGTLGVVDDDAVSLSNLQRQVLHATDRIGTPKVDSAAAALGAINPGVRVEAHACRLTSENADALIASYDLVCDGSDNFDTRYLANAACTARAFRWSPERSGSGMDSSRSMRPMKAVPAMPASSPNALRRASRRVVPRRGSWGALPGIIGVDDGDGKSSSASPARASR